MNRKFSIAGGALVMVLLIVLVSGAMIAGWVSVMGAQTLYVDTLDETSCRRIALENATAYAREYMLTQVLTKGSAAEIATTSLPDGAGTITIGENTDTPLSTFAPTEGWNRFDPGDGEGYAVKVEVQIDLTAALSDGMQARYGADTPPVYSYTYDFMARSRCPVLSGDALIVNKPTLDADATASVSGTMAVSGRSMLWVPDDTNSYEQTMATYVVPIEPQTTLNGTFSGFPFVKTTAGDVSGTPNYDGKLDVVANASGINSLVAKAATGSYVELDGSEVEGTGVECDGAGTVRVDLSEHSLGNVIIDGNTSTLILEGQNDTGDYTLADQDAAILIVLNQTSATLRDLTTVQMTFRNARRVALAIKKNTGTAVTFDVPNAGTGPWRAVLTLENTPSSWSIPGGQTLALTGGIQTDRDIAIPAGAIAITPESTGYYLERLAARNGWVEAFQQVDDE